MFARLPASMHYNCYTIWKCVQLPPYTEVPSITHVAIINLSILPVLVKYISSILWILIQHDISTKDHHYHASLSSDLGRIYMQWHARC